MQFLRSDDKFGFICRDAARSVSTATARNVSTASACSVSTAMKNISPKKGSLAVIIRSFKSAVTKKVREAGYNNFSWQPRYFDRIIRNEKELYNIRKYITQKPLIWELEKGTLENIFD